MAGVARFGVWPALAAAVVPLLLGGGHAVAAGQGQPGGQRVCGARPALYEREIWRFLHLLSAGRRTRHDCVPAHRYRLVVRWGAERGSAGRCAAGRFRTACGDRNHRPAGVPWGGRMVSGPAPWRITPHREGGSGAYRGTHKGYRGSQDPAVAPPYAPAAGRGGAYGPVSPRTLGARRVWGVLRNGDEVLIWER